MNNLLKLTKINLLTFFDLSKIKNSKNKNELFKACGKVLFILFGLFVFGYFIYDMANKSMPGYIYFNVPHILLVQFFVMSSILVLFTNILKINGTLFNFKDYNLLMSLPIRKSTIILSKLIILYIANLIYIMIFMIPAYLIYIKYISVNITFNILFWISLFIIPLVPIIISTIIGTLLTGITSKFKNKNIINFILTFALFIGVIILSSSLETASAIDMANIGKSMVKIFNSIYPLTELYTNIILNNSITSMIIFIFIPIILFYLFFLIVNNFYNKINNNLSKTYTKSNYKFKNSKTNTPLIALYKKELKRYFSSANYILNTAIGAILLTISTIMLIFVGKGEIDKFIGIEGLSNMFISYGPILLGSFCALSCTTNSSISLEGKNLWIIKSIPTSSMTIFKSKILVNLTILIPTIIINGILLSIYLKVNLLTFLLMIITPTTYAICISLIGIVTNLYLPLLTWKNEIRVIKQSASAIISLICGAIIALIPFNINHNLNDTTYTIIITIAVLILNAILYLFLKTKGDEKFKAL